jgi:hypothetical protein
VTTRPNTYNKTSPPTKLLNVESDAEWVRARGTRETLCVEFL